MNYASIIILLSLILIVRNIYRSSKPVVESRINPREYSINSDGTLKLDNLFFSGTKRLFCTKVKLNIPYDTLISTDKFSQISRKIAYFSTLNKSIYSYIIDAYTPLDERKTSKKLVNVKLYQEFIKSKNNGQYDQLINKISNVSFHNSKILILCSPDANELEKHIGFMGIELSSLLGIHPQMVIEKEKFQDTNLLADLFKRRLTIKKNTIYDRFGALITPGLPDSSDNICVGKSLEGPVYCMKWIDDFERHVGIIGPTGAGKTTLLYTITLNLISKGVNVSIMDPKGDLVTLLEDKGLTEHPKLEVLTGYKEDIVEELAKKDPENEKALIIDEAWRVLSNTVKFSKTYHLFRESRSKKLRIIYATQNPWDLSSTVYSNTGTFIVFANQNLTYIRGVSEITGLGIGELSSLNTRIKFRAIVLRNGHFRPDIITIFKIKETH
ncbi:MAG: type IV secretory system conjugative DNA transfer family protein [Desulfurococcales archaeon]|nr:type IV secretory system conjugative DNA transfer family protein [Desulfurococcales archaeon]